MRRSGIISLLLLIIVLEIVTTSCGVILESLAPLNGDWSYDLPGDYSIWRINCFDITLFDIQEANRADRVFREDNNNFFIQAFCNNNHYLCLKYATIPSRINGTTKEEIYRLQSSFCLFDLTREEEPLFFESEKELADKLSEFIDALIIDWISTETKPKGAYYP